MISLLLMSKINKLTAFKSRFLRLAGHRLLLTGLTLICLNIAVFASEHAPDIKVMSFNIRYGTANDGDNRWELRKDLVIDTIENFQPDLLGCQEALQFQVEYLQDKFPEYAVHGVGRDDGKTKGEYAPIYYLKSRFSLVDSGHYWLSETPDVVGSKSWDAAITRMVSWVVLEDLKNNNARLIYANTHFDHIGRTARHESARLIRAMYNYQGEGMPAILTGDFNAGEDSLPYQALVQGDGTDSEPMLDTYREINPEKYEGEGTFGSWTGRTSGARIDWILTTKHFDSVNAMIDHTNIKGRYPSDHFPVEAIIRLK